jgi:hypothetical protein
VAITEAYDRGPGQLDGLARRIEHVPLEELVPNPKNPKTHRTDVLDASVGRFGYIEPVVIDGRTGYLVSGHGRTETLRTMQERGDLPPEGVSVGADGRWLVPAVTGWSSRTDREADAALVALNRTTELGGWDNEALADIVSELAANDALDGVGFDAADLDAVLADIAGSDADGADPIGPEYSRRTDAIQYEPTSETPPPVGELVDRSKAELLTARISEADLPHEVRDFLVAAAQRHLVFDYAQIAEFYAHAGPEVQALMEESALVIVDFDDAIKHGYVRLSSRLSELLGADEAERDRERADA